MTNQLSAIAQMVHTSERQQKHPVLTIRYGDANIGRDSLPANDLEAMECTAMDTGLKMALAWLARMGASHNEPLQPTDPRVRHMQIINLAAVDTGLPLWCDDLPADQNPYSTPSL